MNAAPRSRNAIEFQDIVAATFVVGGDLQSADFTTLSEAIASLQSPGGKIVCLDGSHRIPATIDLPNMEVEIVGCGPGATVLVPTFSGGPLFRIPDGLTGFHRYMIRDLSSVGGNVAGDAFLEVSDANSYGKPYIQFVQLTGWQIALDITDGDQDYTEPVEVRFAFCTIFSPAADSPLVTSPMSAGSFDFGMVVWFDQCMLSNEQGVAPILDLGWKIDFDGDLILSGTPHLTCSSNSACDGLMCSDGLELECQGACTFEIMGQSYWGVCTGKLFGGGGTYKISGSWSNYYIKPFSCSIVVNAIQVQITVNTFFTPAAVQVDILAGANYCMVTGEFLDSTTAAIRTAATYGSFRGCFASTGAHKTILELAGANFNIAAGCTGISTGGGVTKVGANSLYDTTIANVA